jgi:deoxyguanosine kinase
MTRGILVEICGGVASGKTTLSTVLADAGFVPNLEDFRSNPFWEAFYQDPRANAFETEITFLLQHYHGEKKARLGTRSISCDYSLLLDLAYSRVTLKGKRLAIFEEVFREAWGEVGPPNLLVYLRCDPETELKRIRRRGRKVEKSIDTGYLSALHASVDSVVSQFRSTLNILEIDSAATNFAELNEVRIDVRNKVLKAMSVCGNELPSTKI